MFELNEKPKLVSISGPLHSGKSTISKMLSLEFGHCAYLDADVVSTLVRRDFSGSATIDELAPATIEAVSYILRQYLTSGISVILDCVLDDKDRKNILSRLEGVSYDCYWFLLKPDIKKALTQSRNRVKLRDWEIERINIHYGSSIVVSGVATIVDSTDLSPEETFKIIKGEIE